MSSRRLLVLAAIGATAIAALAPSLASSGQGAPAPRYSPLFTVLAGGHEVSETGAANAGDPDGRGSATIVVHGGGRLCYAIVVTKIDKPVGAHIHRGLPGQSGPIVIPLDAPTRGNPGTISGCVSGVSRGLITELERESGNFYVNVHTRKYPAGAVRGNLH